MQTDKKTLVSYQMLDGKKTARHSSKAGYYPPPGLCLSYGDEEPDRLLKSGGLKEESS